MTLVVDASAIVEFVLGSARGRQVAELLRQHDSDLHAPELVTAESMCALRAMERRGDLARARADEAFGDLLDVPIRRYPTASLASRVWLLRGRLTLYDAHYIALAEALDAAFVTGDRRLAAAADGLIDVITA